MRSRLLIPVVWAHVMIAVASAADDPTFVRKGQGAELRVGGDVVATFVTDDPKVLRPYFANVYTRSGHQVTRNHPPIAGTDAVDHDTMHPGVWLGFGDISGVDYWRNKARVATTLAIPDAPVGGAAVMETLSLYHAPDGALVARQTTRHTAVLRPGGYLLIIDATFRPGPAGLTFGDQEEMGLGVRIATPLTEKNGGRVATSAGARTAKEAWGKAAAWADYSGVIGGRRVGVTVFAAPGNFRETWWHVRDYGLMVANAFGRKAMKQGETSRVRVTGAGLRLVYGVFVHDGPADAPLDLAAEYEAFCQRVR